MSDERALRVLAARSSASDDRRAAAGHPATPPEVLSKLAKDDHSAVREAALENLRSRGV